MERGGGVGPHPSQRPFCHGKHRSSTGDVHWRPGKASRAVVTGYQRLGDRVWIKVKDFPAVRTPGSQKGFL